MLVDAAIDYGVLLILGALLITRVAYRQFGLPNYLGWERIAALVVAMAVVAIRRRAARWKPPLAMAVVVSAVAFGMALIALPIFHVDVSDPIRARLMDLAYRPHAAKVIYHHDDRYGYVLVPGTQDFDKTADYNVTYTIDADGNRVMPPGPAGDPAPVIFLGDSVTFGVGVGDTETFPYRLAAGLWKSVPVRNLAVPGFGFTQMYLRLLDALKNTRPRAVVVGAIANDLRRSHLRPPLVSGLERRLEFIDGAFVSKAAVYGTPPAETPELQDREAQVAEDVLLRMNQECRGRGIPFAIVLLLKDSFPPQLPYALGQGGVRVIDLTGLPLDVFRYDAHPTPEGHRRIADALAAQLHP